MREQPQAAAASQVFTLEGYPPKAPTPPRAVYGHQPPHEPYRSCGCCGVVLAIMCCCCCLDMCCF